MRRAISVSLAASLVLSPMVAGAQTTTTGSVGCATLVQAAANGMTARMAADQNTIQQPKSVTSLSCLGNFFNGVGLNLVTNLLNPGSLLQSVEGQICNAIQSTWNSWLGQVQCGLTVTGFNLGFGGLGGGLSCPSLNFGGGGPPISTIGVGTNGSSSGLYINGNGMTPTGYPMPTTPLGSF
ncbi:MAG: hypothetical protein J0H19_01215 [Rhodospirillales bacterium]|mgnify:CR=1 FL=1|nr:hypothetical protein [Rhodospirillales bacterium]